MYDQGIAAARYLEEAHSPRYFYNRICFLGCRVVRLCAQLRLYTGVSYFFLSSPKLQFRLPEKA